MSTVSVLREVRDERRRQDTKFPDQRLRLTMGDSCDRLLGSQLAAFRLMNDLHKQDGTASWATVLMEEALEAVLELDPAKAREELVQVAAVAVRTIENIDAKELL